MTMKCCSILFVLLVDLCNQTCTGTLNENRKDVEEVRISFDDEKDNEINMKNGRFFFDGINVLWNAVNTKVPIEEIWKMRFVGSSKSLLISRGL